MKNILIIGAGPAGLGAAHKLSDNCNNITIIDKRDVLGGLCSNFVVNGYTFDRFVHLSFAKDEDILSIYRDSTDILDIPVDIWNINKNSWIPHPVQDNLAFLNNPLLSLVYLFSFIFRSRKVPKNYGEWLINQYGMKVAKDFPFKYTNKYWQMNPYDMETIWVSNRMTKITLNNFFKSIFSKTKNINYYTSIFNYPKASGFSSFFRKLYTNINFIPNTTIDKISIEDKIAYSSNGSIFKYDVIINSSPLNESSELFNIRDSKVQIACNNLNYTSGYIVSIGLKSEPKGKGVFYYNYNENNLVSRVNFPYRKSILNVPKGKYSIQLEVYTKNGRQYENPYKELSNSIVATLKDNKIQSADVEFIDIRFEKYANIIFDNNIYENRQIILDYLKKKDIIQVGRFGLWDYLWSFQALKSGLDVNLV